MLVGFAILVLMVLAPALVLLIWAIWPSVENHGRTFGGRKK